MSAIVGIYYSDGQPVDRGDLERMVDRLAHRGPDGLGLWCEGSVGLGHCMLWTTPESLQERLPVAQGNGDLAITADARLDNREELLALLGRDARQPGGVSDGELILATYERWGEGCLERLLGAFAFVIWDKRRQVLFCARDHFGVKPFYYHRGPGFFAFGSELKALLCLEGVPRWLNEVRVADYLVPMFGDKASTLYRDILRLPPAHGMVVSGEGVRQWEYWALDPSREVRLGSDEEYAEAFRELFVEAVRCRLRSAFPVGSTLSGGLDSSSVACMARTLLGEDGGRPLPTFSVVFDEVPECDERSYIQAVLEQGGFEPHYVQADPLSPFADVDDILWHQDEVFHTPSLFLIWGLHRAVGEHGVRVLLDGLDGDTTVSHGLAYIVELASRGRWIALAREIDGLSRTLKRSRRRILWQYGLRPLVPEPVAKTWRVLRGRDGPAWATNPTIRSDFARRIGLTERIETWERGRAAPARTGREDHYRCLVWGLVPLILEVTDRLAAAYSIEARHPFFDKRLAEFCLALPSGQKLGQGWTRMVLRRAMEGILPVEVQWRRDKADFGPAFRRGLLMADRELVEEVLLNDSQDVMAYVDIHALREAYARCGSRPALREPISIWKAVSLALWLRRTGLRAQVQETNEGARTREGGLAGSSQHVLGGTTRDENNSL